MAGFRVRVIDFNEKPIKDAGVRLEFQGSGPRTSKEEHTDAEGIASFDGYEEGLIIVYVDGSTYGCYHYEEGKQINIMK